MKVTVALQWLSTTWCHCYTHMVRWDESHWYLKFWITALFCCYLYPVVLIHTEQLVIRMFMSGSLMLHTIFFPNINFLHLFLFLIWGCKYVFWHSAWSSFLYISKVLSKKCAHYLSSELFSSLSKTITM